LTTSFFVTSNWGNQKVTIEEAGANKYMGVSKNNGTPKSSILKGFPL